VTISRIALSTVLASVGLLVGCAQRNALAPGDYVAHKTPLVDAKVSIVADKHEVTFSVPGAGPVKRSATAWDLSRWPTLCPRGMHDTRSEVLDLGPEPLVLGATKVERPVLVAECLGHPIVELMSVGADGAPHNPSVVSFER
jgi:hypothetical protein